MENDNLISQSELFERRGWSNRTVKELGLEVATFVKYDPYYKLEDVLWFESIAEFAPFYDNEMITQSILLARLGWTKTMLQKFALTPDAEKDNPYYSSAPPMKLYLLSKIEAIEATQEFQELFAKIQKRKASAKKAVATKMQKSLDLVYSFTVTVKKVEDVVKLAIKHYNDWNKNKEWQDEDYSTFRATLHSDKAFLDRITVNYIRHELTNYDDDLENIANRVGKNRCYDIERKRIFQEIAKVYPEYKNECELQYGKTLFDV